MTFQNQVPPSGTTVSPSLPADFSGSLSPDGTIRHILLGHPSHIRQTIHLLHNLRYVETSQWSPLIEVPDNRLILRPQPDEVISMLVRRL
ncbi:hypothetical protein IQ260_09580 [Leptolyngbya cf. ectocarpi LEGE 11479]|uniref:Uncharacterized protein n=1 Tax=Leptolyngbya cf. ectocarpi LEGE 11479 TaxID=1828722 RepID=A0A928X3G6_LEPEC|nr:hypothetical protein [Leptolyngbya ectocarpi]MBE9066904.1 hypothetical protein [Leptolyngbya cf. ectocarpi LEGE 11479]